METKVDKRCPACEGLNTEFLLEQDGDYKSRCLNPKCGAREWVQKPDGMMIYDRDPLKT